VRSKLNSIYEMVADVAGIPRLRITEYRRSKYNCSVSTNGTTMSLFFPDLFSTRPLVMPRYLIDRGGYFALLTAAREEYHRNNVLPRHKHSACAFLAEQFAVG